MEVFESPDDFSTYLSLLAKNCHRAGVEILTYCLMPNHIDGIAVPEDEGSLARGFGKTHERYAWGVNRRNRWTGHLWQERFYSVPMDRAHTVAAIRYVLQNPVRAGLVERPQDWPYSSASAHLGLVEDPLIRPGALEGFVSDWEAFLSLAESAGQNEALRRYTRSGRPAGNARFVARLERELGRELKPGPVGRPPKVKAVQDVAERSGWVVVRPSSL
jgi:putative transposase